MTVDVKAMYTRSRALGHWWYRAGPAILRCADSHLLGIVSVLRAGANSVLVQSGGELKQLTRPSSGPMQTRSKARSDRLDLTEGVFSVS